MQQSNHCNTSQAFNYYFRIPSGYLANKSHSINTQLSSQSSKNRFNSYSNGTNCEIRNNQSACLRNVVEVLGWITCACEKRLFVDDCLFFWSHGEKAKRLSCELNVCRCIYVLCWFQAPNIKHRTMICVTHFFTQTLAYVVCAIGKTVHNNDQHKTIIKKVFVVIMKIESKCGTTFEISID